MNNSDLTSSIVEGIKTRFVHCPNCDSDNFNESLRYRDLDFNVPGTWPIVKCNNCDQLYMNPQPSEAAFHQIYPSNYVPYQMDLRPDTRPLMRFAILSAYEGAKLKIMDKIARSDKPRILDIGCGAGFFLEMLKRRNWDAVGVEPNEKLVKRAVNELGLDVKQGILATADLEEASFDIITLWHCLEHDPTPKKTLERCFRLLKPSGVVVAQVPDNASWEARTFKNYFWSNDIPRHLNFFTPNTLRQITENCGFNTKKLFPTKNATSWVWSFLRLVKWDLYAEMEKNITKISILYIIFAPFYHLFSKGDWTTGIFEKPAQSSE